MLEAAQVPAGRIYTAADILDDPHYRERDMIERHRLSDGQPIDLPGIVPKLSATPGEDALVGSRAWSPYAGSARVDWHRGSRV